jgi:hypothetical protein
MSATEATDGEGWYAVNIQHRMLNIHHPWRDDGPKPAIINRKLIWARARGGRSPHRRPEIQNWQLAI